MTDEQRRAADIADKIIARTRYRPGTDNYARVFQAAYVGAIEALTRAETPQSIPSEREEIVKWLPFKFGETALDFGRVYLCAGANGHIFREMLVAVGDAGRWRQVSWILPASVIPSPPAAEHLTRQALEQGSDDVRSD